MRGTLSLSSSDASVRLPLPNQSFLNELELYPVIKPAISIELSYESSETL